MNKGNSMNERIIELVDILSRASDQYHNDGLKTFSKEIYRTLNQNSHELPTQAQMMVGFMSKNDWLYHYSTYYGIEMALKGLSRRATFETNMAEAVIDLKRDDNEIEKEFKVFFEDLKTHVHNQLKII